MMLVKAALVGLALLASGINAQVETESGEELCSCSPTVFSFTLDFGATCPGNVVADDAIASVGCDVIVAAQDQSNQQPVLVESITILELNNNDVNNSTILKGPFDNGDVIEYASISSYRNLTETYFPFGLQITVNAENSDYVAVFNTISIEYDTSECDVWPVFPTGSTVGWIEIVSQVFLMNECALAHRFLALIFTLCFCSLYRVRFRMYCQSTALPLP